MDRDDLNQLLPKFNTGAEGEKIIDRPLRALVTRDTYTNLCSNALEDFKTWIDITDTKDEWKELKTQGNHHFTHRKW